MDSSFLNYVRSLYKHLPTIMLLIAINLFIAIKTDLLSDTFFTVVAFLSVNTIFILAIQLIEYLNRDTSRIPYLWRDASNELPQEASYVEVIVEHEGVFHACKAYYSTNLYGKYGGWDIPLDLLDTHNKVVLWRYCSVKE